MDAMVFHSKDINYDEFYFLDENGFSFESHADIFLEEKVIWIRLCKIWSFHSKCAIIFLSNQSSN